MSADIDHCRHLFLDYDDSLSSHHLFRCLQCMSCHFRLIDILSLFNFLLLESKIFILSFSLMSLMRRQRDVKDKYLKCQNEYSLLILNELITLSRS